VLLYKKGVSNEKLEFSRAILLFVEEVKNKNKAVPKDFPITMEFV